MEAFEKVHLWVGTNFAPDEEYNAYFELDYSTEGDLESPNYRVCQFCKDIGELWYDEDFIGIIPRSNEEVELDELLAEAAVEEKELKKVKKVCLSFGIEKANAIFWYADGTVTVPKPYKDDYNGLKYIGLFKGD